MNIQKTTLELGFTKTGISVSSEGILRAIELCNVTVPDITATVLKAAVEPISDLGDLPIVKPKIILLLETAVLDANALDSLKSQLKEFGIRCAQLAEVKDEMEEFEKKRRIEVNL